MNRKRNVNFIKPDDPPFLKVLKKEAGYDNTNHKFDKLENDEKDFVDDEDTELPQVVVLKKGDLTAEEYDIEKERLKKEELETKADLTQKVIFKPKTKSNLVANKQKDDKNKISKTSLRDKKSSQLLSFAEDDIEDSD